jgi:hypothetical protein
MNAAAPRPFSPPGHCDSSGLEQRRGPSVSSAARRARRCRPPRARDRPFRACGRSPHRPRPFRAEMNMVSTPAGKREGLRGVAAHPPRLLRWTRVPGGSPRAAGCVHRLYRALARAQGALAKARARARSRDWSVQFRGKSPCLDTGCRTLEERLRC